MTDHDGHRLAQELRRILPELDPVITDMHREGRHWSAHDLAAKVRSAWSLLHELDHD